MADAAKAWPALHLSSRTVLDPEIEEALAALLDDFSPAAVQDLAPMPLPPGGLWDPTFPPPPDPPPAPLSWLVFFPRALDRDNALAMLQRTMPALSVVARDVDDQDWAARSQRELTAVRAGRFVVAPPWDLPTPSDATLIVIEPSRGFGTGHHASTRLCLQSLDAVDLTGRSVLDLGTGSGVLAIAASLRGAASVVAVDVDEDAIECARHSQALNPEAPPIAWAVGDFRDRSWPLLGEREFDVLLANLTGGMLRSSAARLRELIAPGGTLVCSGFDEDEAPEVEAALGLERCKRLVEQTWVGLTLRAQPRAN